MAAAHVPVLNRHLTLEARVQAPDGSGGFTEAWEPLGRLWAEVRAGTGREAEQDALAVSEVRYRITVRAAPPGRPSRPRPEQRLREGSRIFRILAVAEADRAGRFLVCHTREEEISA